MSRFFGKSNPTSPRTSADRERERLARERRRAGGLDVEDEAEGEHEPEPEADLEPEPEPEPEAAAEPGAEFEPELEPEAEFEPEVELEPHAAHEPEREAEAEPGAEFEPEVDETAESFLAPDAGEAQPARTAAPEEPAPQPEPVALVPPEPEPLEPDRVSEATVEAESPAPIGDEAVPAPPRRSGGLKPPPTRQQGGRGRGALPPAAGRRRRVSAPRVLAGVVILIAAALVWFGVELFEPFTGSGHGRVVVVVPRGDGASEVGDLLARRGVVASGFFFNLYAAVQGERGELHSGTYTLREGMSYSSALGALTQPPPAPPVVSVLVPEGDSRPEIALIATHDGLGGSYLAASVRSPVLSPAHYGAPRNTPNLEGFLFPATYSLDVGANVHTLVAQQLTAFMENVGPDYVRAAHHRHLTLYQLLIVASMIEREAYLPADRAKVAAVIYNRLRLVMPLGIDATLRFALNDWTLPLTESQLQLDSPYNTRLHVGLPPTPIGNPGLASLGAAAHPAHVPYLYYVAGADGCGELVFSTSAASFDRSAAAYQAALAANHGRVPTCHHG